MILPPRPLSSLPCLSICRAAARAISQDWVTLASITSRKSSGFWSTIFDTLLSPEATTRISRRPNFATAASTMASQLASELGRLATTSVLPPSASHSAATFLSSSALLAASTTLPPAPAGTLAASAPKAPDAPVTIAVLPLMSNSAVGFFRKSSDMGFPCFSVRVFGKAGAGGWGWTRARSRIPHPAALRAATLPEDGEGEVTSLRRGHRHEHRHDVIAAVDDLALFVGAD